MIIYEKYENKKDYCWYDSSNVIHSECYDNEKETKNVKVIFKNGRTYLYKDVPNDDYIAFRMAESNGKAISEILKKYDTVRIADTNLDELEKMKTEFINSDNERNEVFSKLTYHISYDDKDGTFILFINDKPIYNAVEGKVSIINLFKSMSIGYSLSEMTEEEKKSLKEKDDELR